MKTVRIGNDINVTWKIMARNGVPYQIEDREIELWLVSGPYKMRISSYSVESENSISFSIDAPDLKRYGVYKLLLRIFDNESTTEDSAFDLVEIFQIVSTSYPDSSSVLSGNVDLEYTSVLNNVFVSTLRGDPGKSAYEIAVEHGYEGTEEEWISTILDQAIAGRVATLETKIQELEDTDFDGEVTDDTDYDEIEI